MGDLPKMVNGGVLTHKTEKTLLIMNIVVANDVIKLSMQSKAF